MKAVKSRVGALLLSGVLALSALPGLALAAAPTEAYENGSGRLDMEKVAGYSVGAFHVDGGVMEIVAYNSQNQYAYAVNGQSGLLAMVSLAGLQTGAEEATLTGTDFDVRAAVEAMDASFQYGDMTSVTVSPDGQLLAVALQAAGHADAGRVAIFRCGADGSLELEQLLTVGVQPDMLTFSPDGAMILTANEGEPREGYGEGTVDPAGSVSVIRLGETASVSTLGFEAFDSAEARQALVDAGVVLMQDTLPSLDLEPEYIACTNSTAYVTLQEANAIAVLDLATERFTGIYSAGFEDYSVTPVDIDKKDDAYAPKTYESLLGIRMPDGIAVFTADGQDYLVTANEGDAREWGDEDAGTFYLNEDERDFGDEGVSSPTGAITKENSGLDGKVVFFKSEDFDGLDSSKDYLFGGRSFTVYQVEADGLTELFTSGDDFEALTYQYLPDYYNSSNDNAVLDDRSGKKGPEAESVTVGVVDGKTYAFVALERTGGIMAYDLSNPAEPQFANYINSRDFESIVEGSEVYEDGELDKWVTGGDVAPEGLAFIPAAQSPTGTDLLLAACEVSGTIAVYQLGEQAETVTLPFQDVSEEDWFYSAVAYAYANGLMQGTSETTFEPDTTTQRAMLITLLWNLEGQPQAETSADFSDVPAGQWYSAAIDWAVEQGIVEGNGDGSFSPEAPLTREAMVTALYRYAATKGQDLSAQGDLAAFQDADQASDWAREALIWALGEGLIQGKGAGILDPQGLGNRAELATLMMHYCEMDA